MENCQVFAIWTAAGLHIYTHTNQRPTNWTFIAVNSVTTSNFKWECDVNFFPSFFLFGKVLWLLSTSKAIINDRFWKKEPQINRRFFSLWKKWRGKLHKSSTNNGIKATDEKLKFLFIFFFHSVSCCLFFVLFFYESHQIKLNLLDCICFFLKSFWSYLMLDLICETRYLFLLRKQSDFGIVQRQQEINKQKNS